MKTTIKNLLVSLRLLPLYHILRTACFFLYAPLALPFVLVMRLASPWILVRIAQIDVSNIGHSTSLEAYLCERSLGFHKEANARDIFYTRVPPANAFYLAKYRELLTLFPESRLMYAIDQLNRLFPGYKKHLLLHEFDEILERDRQLQNVMGGIRGRELVLGRKPYAIYAEQSGMKDLSTQTSPHITFNDEETLRGERFLEEIGLGKESKYICFLSRDSVYKTFKDKKRDWSYHNFRDSSVENYLPMTDAFIKKGYSMIRMGYMVKGEIPENPPFLIDYAKNHRSEFLDLFLVSKCSFVVSSACGFMEISAMFRKPLTMVNATPIGVSIGGYTEHDVFIPKKYWVIEEKRFLTFREIFESGAALYFHSKDFMDAGIELVENSPEEITDVALETEKRLLGQWRETEEEIELQKRFRATWKGCKVAELRTRVGAQFLKNNVELLN